MIPKTLRLSNFTSYAQNPPPLDFERFHLACLSGPNGAGKSSLLDAITFALWGEARGKSSDELVRLGANKLQVEFEFALEKNFYRVRRTRDKKRQLSELELYRLEQEGKKTTPLTEATLKETQVKINSLLRLSYETFVNSSFLKQGRADEFTLKGPTDRKRILSEILDLSFWDEQEEKAKAKTKNASFEIARLEAQLTEIEVELVNAQSHPETLKEQGAFVADLTRKIASLEKEEKAERRYQQELLVKKNEKGNLENEVIRLERELLALRRQITETKARLEELRLLLTQKAEIQNQVARLTQLRQEEKLYRVKRTEAEKLQAKLFALRLHRQELQARNAKLKEEMHKIKNQLDALKNDALRRCPLCGSSLTDRHQKDVVAELQKKGEALAFEYRQNRDDPSHPQTEKLEAELKLLYDHQKHSTVLETIDQLTVFEEKYRTLIGAESEEKSKKESLKSQEEKTREFETQRQTTKKRLETFLPLAIDLETTGNKLHRLETEIGHLRRQENEARELLGEAKKLFERGEQLKKEREKKRQERQRLLGEHATLEELALSFGKKGVQAMLIENAIPAVEQESNRLLEKLTGGNLKLTLLTQSENKKGEVFETLEIVITDELGSRPYELYSSGEAFRVNLALRLALSKLLTQRAGTKLQFLVIDEGFGTQDREGKERLIEAISSIKDDYEKILVVTHLEDLKEAFPVRIEVAKTANGSTFEIIGA